MKFDIVTDYLNKVKEEYKMVGLDCKVMKGYEVVYRYIKGNMDADSEKPLTEDTLFEIFSATKMTTMVAVMQLINVNISVYTFAYIRMYNLAYYMFGLGQTYNKSFSLTALPSFLVLFFLLNMILQTI